MKLQTPLYNSKNFPNVYEPREDTFLLLDALEMELDFLKSINPLIVGEIGSGSGVILTAISSIFKEKCVYFASDINSDACSMTMDTSILNQCNLQVLNMNLMDAFKTKMFDILLFNPPYVCTESKEIEGEIINKSWAGGVMGREIIDKVLVNLPNLLSETGVCYMVILKENKPEEIINFVEKLGLKSSIILNRKIIGEHLFILKFYK